MCAHYLQFNQPICNFREKRLLFGTVPLNLTSVRTINLENKGSYHAYFKVIFLCIIETNVSANLNTDKRPVSSLWDECVL